MKISNMDGDCQKKKLQGVCGECQSSIYNGVGCTPSEFHIQDAPFSLPSSFQKVNI